MKCTALIAMIFFAIPTVTLAQSTNQPSNTDTPAATAAPGPSQDDEPKEVDVSSGIMQGFLLTSPQPVYPKEAKEKGIQGTVVVAIVIDTTGHVTEAKAESGPLALQPAAVEAVKNWTYKPFLANGSPAIVDTHVKVVFSLAR